MSLWNKLFGVKESPKADNSEKQSIPPSATSEIPGAGETTNTVSSATHTHKESDTIIHIEDGWEMPRNEAIVAMKRSVPHSLAYNGPINENGLVDPWNTASPVSFFGLNLPTIATRTDYVRGPKSVGASHSWSLCAAELVLANAVADWSDFLGADVKYAVSLFPKAQNLIFVWVWFHLLHRADNCFIFLLDPNDPDQLGWLKFLWRSKKLAIRNGPEASDTTNVCVNFEQGGALDFLGKRIGS